jgi:hypothetical protein
VTEYGGWASLLSRNEGDKGVTTDKPLALESCVCDKVPVVLQTGRAWLAGGEGARRPRGLDEDALNYAAVGTRA